MRRKKWLLISIAILALSLSASHRKTGSVVLAPQKSHVLGAIAAIGNRPPVRLKSIQAQIRLSPAQSGSNYLQADHESCFLLENLSGKDIYFDCAFPVSKSPYSLAVYLNISIRSGEQMVEITPQMLENLGLRSEGEKVSIIGNHGKEQEGEDAATGSMGFRIGEKTYHSLIRWKEHLSPVQTKKIRIRYQLNIPVQLNHYRRSLNRCKMAWKPTESARLSNPIPLRFLGMIPENRSSYFFDFLLKSASSWAGPVAECRIDLLLDRSLTENRLFSNIGSRLIRITDRGDRNAVLFRYSIRDRQPIQNIYFAIPVAYPCSDPKTLE